MNDGVAPAEDKMFNDLLLKVLNFSWISGSEKSLPLWILLNNFLFKAVQSV